MAPIADETGHPVPSDSCRWSQIIVSVLTGIVGLKRKKGQDFSDGSDVKAANLWEAIDTPRFNSVLKTGTKAAHSGKLTYLDGVPFTFFALWDHDLLNRCRFRMWVVRTQIDPLFREMADSWYNAVRSKNFQLQPPRNRDDDVLHNEFGTFSYPLLFSSTVENGKYRSAFLSEDALTSGLCKLANNTPQPLTHLGSSAIL